MSRRWSEERKRNFSQLAKERGFGKWMTGRHLSEETKVILRKKLGGKNHPFYGKKLSESHKLNLSLNHADVSDENNPSWKEDVGYFALHAWLQRRLGKKKKCEHCGRIDKKKYEWANKDHKYRRVISDWIRLCTSCHRKFDILNNNYRVAFLQRSQIINISSSLIK